MVAMTTRTIMTMMMMTAMVMMTIAKMMTIRVGGEGVRGEGEGLPFAWQIHDCCLW